MKKTEIRRILRLNSKFEYLFSQNELMSPMKIKYKFCKENENGFIEYKRTLSTYTEKKGKLLRQIYWRIHENFIEQLNKDNKSIRLKCFYVIGLEDNGSSSKMSLEELNESLEIITEAIKNTNINIIYLYLLNEIDKSYLLLVKLELDNDLVNFDFF